MIDKTLNPFDVNVDKSHLFNIATGKLAINFTRFKLNVEEKRYQTTMAKLLQHVWSEKCLAVF